MMNLNLAPMGSSPAIHAVAAGRCPTLFPEHGVSATVSGGGTTWMAGTSPAMTAEWGYRKGLPPQNKKYLCAIGSLSAGSHTSSTPSAVTA
jgi:hypothetical protein